MRDARRALWLRTARHDVSAEELQASAEVLREHIGDGPIRRTDLDELVGKDRSIPVGLWVDLVRAPPSGTWERRRADLYAVAEARLGPPPADLTVEAATEHLVRRYLRGFGPATAADAAGWGGLRTADVQAVLERLDLRRFSTVDGVALYDLPGAPIPDAATPAPVRFLPTWDASLLVHARRKGVIAEAHRTLVFNTRTPHSVCTFLVDGTVAGTWRYDKGRCGWRRSSRWPPACSRRSRPRRPGWPPSTPEMRRLAGDVGRRCACGPRSFPGVNPHPELGVHHVAPAELRGPILGHVARSVAWLSDLVVVGVAAVVEPLHLAVQVAALGAVLTP